MGFTALGIMTRSSMAFSTTAHDSKYNGIQYNNTRHNVTEYKKNAALCIITLSMMVRDGVMLSVTNKLLLNAAMLSVVRLNVVSP